MLVHMIATTPSPSATQYLLAPLLSLHGSFFAALHVRTPSLPGLNLTPPSLHLHPRPDSRPRFLLTQLGSERICRVKRSSVLQRLDQKFVRRFSNPLKFDFQFALALLLYVNLVPRRRFPVVVVVLPDRACSGSRR